MPDASPPIHRLPPEILVHIFRQLHLTEGQLPNWYERDIEANKQATLKRARIPYSVSSVCKYWDEVSTLAPEIWYHTRILVSLGSVCPAQMARKCLERAPHNDPFTVHVVGEKSPEVGKAYERQRVISLLPLVSRYIHRISELSVLTTFTTSLPPFSLLCPSPSSTLIKLQVGTYKCNASQDSPLPIWPTVPSTQHVPEAQDLDLSGHTFISYCRIVNHLGHSINLPSPQTLKIQNLSSATSEAFSLEELLEFLERLAPMPNILHLIDVDLRLVSKASEALATYQDGIYIQTRWTNLTRVNAETVSAFLSLCRRGVYPLQDLFVDDCSLPSPIGMPPITVPCLHLQSLDTSSIINLLHVVDPKSQLIIAPRPGHDTSDGVELFPQLDRARRSNGDFLLNKTDAIAIESHGYIPLDSICQFVENKYAGHRDSGHGIAAPSCLQRLGIVPSLADWERMKANASDKWTTQRVNNAVESRNSWDIRVENCSVLVHQSQFPSEPVDVQFIKSSILRAS
ncbi:hypothetical protein BKA70DRAFT_171973 [Coprinopsis sp. MPI-PUGE-AT-0042]|nr:hypothetical protein BKA70DRAFT_171973 [Coprinopsis sp. MPI-PUGE-AT-0042]